MKDGTAANGDRLLDRLHDLKWLSEALLIGATATKGGVLEREYSRRYGDLGADQAYAIRVQSRLNRRAKPAKEYAVQVSYGGEWLGYSDDTTLIYFDAALNLKAVQQGGYYVDAGRRTTIQSEIGQTMLIDAAVNRMCADIPGLGAVLDA